MATRFITVSIEIMHDENLSANQKFILAEIEQLTQLDKGCIASNQHFAELTGMAKESVSRCIRGLEDKEYISTEIVKGSRNHIRVIRINKMLSPPKQNVNTPLTKCLETKENKTTNKTTNTKLTAFDTFIKELKAICPTKSKITKTKEGERIFKEIKDTLKLQADYKEHQIEKKEFAQRITAFMEDYTPTVNNITPKRTFGVLPKGSVIR